MTERGFDTGFWSDGFIRKIDFRAKLLYTYLFTNEHCNPAGLYPISIDIIAFETGLSEDEIPDLLEKLRPKIVWYPDKELVWVKNFIKRQSKSPKFLAAAAKSLLNINYPEVVNDLLSYNVTRHSISIPYQYYIDTHARAELICSSASASADAGLGVNSATLIGGNSKEVVARVVNLYEESFGVVAKTAGDDLKDFCQLYPVAWIEKAIIEARNNHAFAPAKYMSKTLNNWSVDGGPPTDVVITRRPKAGKEAPQYILKGLKRNADT